MRVLKNIIYSESFGGILLFLMGLCAVIMSNSQLGHLYDSLINMIITLEIGSMSISKQLVFWINDGLMVIFFLLIGLEIKREVIGGMLKDRAMLAVPLFGALGGMAVPSLLYILITYGDAGAAPGWAIPAATDIAFTLGILSLLGSRVPVSVKLFLTALAVLDDVGAIIIIAIFYTPKLSMLSLALAGMFLVILYLLNRFGVKKLWPYFVIGAFMWLSVLKSGVHATLAGVLLAMFIPHDVDPHTDSPLETVESRLFPWVTFFILPSFAFVNSGFSLSGLTLYNFVEPVTLGIAVGLFVGKQIGVFSSCWLALKFKLGKLPEGIGWRHLYGISVLCGVGFTMSLFIGTLAYDYKDIEHARDVRLGILIGSFLSGALGYWLLRRASEVESASLPPK